MASTVFISYRRALSSDLAHEVAAVLRKRLPGIKPYLDVESIAGGTNFVEAIETEIALADALVVLIPPDWAGIRDAEGQLRLHQHKDHVRAEVAAALKRGVEIVPVLVDQIEMPDAEDLPEELRGLTAWNAVPVRSSLSDEDAAKLSEAVRKKIPGRLTAFLLQIAAMQSGLFLLPYFLIGALILFSSHVLQIHFLPTEETFAKDVGLRDLGFFAAVNWTIVLFLLWPMVLYCAHQVLGDAQTHIGRLRDRKLIVFVGPDGQRTARSPNALWRRILAQGTWAIFGLILLSLILASYNWWDFSGRWPVTDFPLADFHRSSTGIDWQVAWAVDARYAQSALAIKLLALICYNLYNFGWIIGYAILVFAAIFVAQLESVAEGTGNHRADRLIVEEDATQTGGFDALDRMQRSLSVVALASAAAMYLMAIRNYFLPPGCQPISLTEEVDLTAHCFSTLGIFETSAVVLGSSLGWGAEGAANRGILWAGAAKSANSFTVGSLFAVALTLALFTYVNTKLGRIVRRSRLNAGQGGVPVSAARPLGRTLHRRGLLVQALLVLSAAALVWPNLSVIYGIAVGAGMLSVIRPTMAR